ncbi:MAG: 2-phospho-L-lactate transferase CofD family protein [Candidatus Absconditabacteria bacterium]
MKVVTIGGGTGAYNLLPAIKNIPNIEISSIVTMSDDGGSTGKLRDEFGVLPSGDIRRALVALSDDEKSKYMREMFNYRFNKGGISGHNLGNLIMLALEDIAGDYGKSIDILEELFEVKGKVYPVTFEKTKLLAKLEDGSFVLGESNLDFPKHNGNLKIEQLFVLKEDYGKILEKVLKEEITIQPEILNNIISNFSSDSVAENPKLAQIILEADFVIFGPGDLYGSIMSNLVVGNMKQLLLKSKAKKIYINNLFTKYGETSTFKLSDFVETFEKFFGEDIFDYILVHDRSKYPIDSSVLESYKSENKKRIENNGRDKRIIKADFVKTSDFARHSSDKLRVILEKILV